MLGHKPGDVLEKFQTEGIQIRFLRIGFVDAFLQYGSDPCRYPGGICSCTNEEWRQRHRNSTGLPSTLDGFVTAIVLPPYAVCGTVLEDVVAVVLVLCAGTGGGRSGGLILRFIDLGVPVVVRFPRWCSYRF